MTTDARLPTQAEAWAEYKRIEGRALAEYKRIQGLAWAEYKRACADIAKATKGE